MPFRLLGQGYCRGPMASANRGQQWGRGVMGRTTDALPRRADCERACEAAGAACSAYGWGPCFPAYDAHCRLGDRNCALYGWRLEYDIPAAGNWSGIPEWVNRTVGGVVHSSHAHPERVVGSVQNEHDGNVCWLNCHGPCPPPPPPAPPHPPTVDDGAGWGAIVVALALGVVLAGVGMALAARMRVIHVSVPLNSPLLGAAGAARPAAGQPGERQDGAEAAAVEGAGEQQAGGERVGGRYTNPFNEPG